MGLNRRSFLRALIGAPFATKALERIITNGIAAPVVEPVKPTPEPKWIAPVNRDWNAPEDYQITGYSYSGTPVPVYDPGVIRVYTSDLNEIGPGDPVKVDPDGKIVRCENNDEARVGWVVQTQIEAFSDEPIQMSVDIHTEVMRPWKSYARHEWPKFYE